MQKYGKLKIPDVLRMFTLILGQFIGFLCIYAINPHSRREKKPQKTSEKSKSDKRRGEK